MADVLLLVVGVTLVIFGPDKDTRFFGWSVVATACLLLAARWLDARKLRSAAQKSEDADRR